MTDTETGLLLPAGTRLLHIGPHKTGTSSLQSAFHLARGAAARRGVHYAGTNRQPLRAAQAAAARRSRRVDPEALKPWRDVLREVQGSTAKRVLISSEWFSDANDEAIRLLAADLETTRLHVVVTVRPLAGILPSQWQQYVQAGMTTAYEPWLASVLTDPDPITPTFWHRHRHDELVARWAAEIGSDRVTVVVADDRDHGAVLRSFEALVGLPSGVLVPEDDRANRSLTRAEIELVREMNAAFNAEGIDPRTRLSLVLFGAAGNLKVRQPERDEPRIETPAWAIEPIAAHAGRIVAGLRASGVRVIGDLEILSAPVTSFGPGAGGSRSPSPADPRWPAVTATGAMGVLVRAGLAHDVRRGWPDAWPEDDAGVGPVTRGGHTLATATAAAAPFSTARLRKVFGGRFRRVGRGRVPVLRRLRRGPGEATPIHSMPAEVE